MVVQMEKLGANSVAPHLRLAPSRMPISSISSKRCFLRVLGEHVGHAWLYSHADERQQPILCRLRHARTDNRPA